MPSDTALLLLAGVSLLGMLPSMEASILLLVEKGMVSWNLSVILQTDRSTISLKIKYFSALFFHYITFDLSLERELPTSVASIKLKSALS